MEIKYLITTKQEFSSLYRFGSIPIINHYVVDFFEDLEKQKEAFISKFKELPYFLGDEEYLFLKIELEKNSDRIQMSWVKDIIPITWEAKVSLASKFNPKLMLSEPIFEKVIKEVEFYIDIQDRFKGAEAIIEIYFPGSKSDFPKDKNLLESALKYRMEGEKSNEVQGDFITNLLLYERYEFFPNSDLGYFYDIGEIFAFSKGKPTFKGSKLHQYLEGNKPDLVNLKLSQIIPEYQNSSEALPFRTQLLENEIQLDIVGLFFLKFKAEFLEKESLSHTSVKKSVEYLVKHDKFLKEIKSAVYLIGLFFGFIKIYEEYYDHLSLSVFKSKPKTEPVKPTLEIEEPNNKVDLEEESKEEPQDEGFKTGDNVQLLVTTNIDEVSKEDRLLSELNKFIGDRKVVVNGGNLEEMKVFFQKFNPKIKWNQRTILSFIKENYSENFDFPTKTSIKISPPIK